MDPLLIVFGSLLIVFLVIAFRFPEELKDLLRRIVGVEVTKSGLKIALAAATAAVEEKENRTPDDDELRPLLREIPAGRRVLWVDDLPANNRSEIEALRSLGLVVDAATTNAEALDYASANAYDLVLSDIGRSASEPPTAGLALPEALLEANVRAPFAFYVGQAEGPTTEGGQPVFDKPTQLLGWVRDQLRGTGR